MTDHESNPDTEDNGESVVRNYVDADRPGSEFETSEMPALDSKAEKRETSELDETKVDEGDEQESVVRVVADPEKPGSSTETIATTKSDTEARLAGRDAEDEFATVEHVPADPERPGSTSETKVFEQVEEDEESFEDHAEAATKLSGKKKDPFDDLETREVPVLKEEWKQRAAEVTAQESDSDDSWGDAVEDKALAASVAAASGEMPLPTTEEPSEVAGPVLAKARAAQEEWALLRFEQRLPFFDALRHELVAQRTDYVPSMATAIGRPMVEALVGEYLPVLEALKTLDELVPPVLVDQHAAGPAATADGVTAAVKMVPYGVVVIANGIHSPFAFPMTLAIDALATGNAVLICGVEQHPRVNEVMRKMFRRAGFPENLLQVIGGDSETMRVVAEARPDKFIYEGSTDLAARLATKCVDAGCEFQIIRKAKDMMVVLQNADMDRAVDAVLTAAFATGGMQTGTLERVVVHEGIYDEFRMRFINAIRTMNSHHAQLAMIKDNYNPRRAQMLMDDAIAKGARVTYPAGEEPGRWIHWKAAVIESLAPTAKLSNERLEGPGCALYRSDDPPAEAQRLLRLLPANNLSVQGDPNREQRAKLENLSAARIAFNDPILGGTATGGGVPVGAESPRSVCGPLAMLRPKLVSSAEDEGRRIAWFPYTDDKAYALMDAMEAMYGTETGKRLKAALKPMINPTKRRLLKGDE